jgi:hypothetical protein
MKLRNVGYAVAIAATAAMFVLGSAVPSDAAKKKKAAAAKPHFTPACSSVRAPVCATKGGIKFTYVNACFAGNDGASVNSNKACPTKAAKKGGKKKGGKKAKKKK